MDTTSNTTVISSGTQTQEPLTPKLIEKEVDENAIVIGKEIKKTVWKMRTHGLWAGGALGLFFGAAIGALAVASTAFVGVPLVAIGAMMLPIVGKFAIYGMLTGSVALSTVDLTAGAIVGSEKVNQRKKLLQSPSEEKAESLRYGGLVKDKETFWNRIIPFAKGSEKIFTLRTALIFGALGLGIGMLLSSVTGVGIVWAISGIVGKAIAANVAPSVAPALTTAAFHAFEIASCTLFGALFGVDVPTLASNATQFVADTFSGKVFERGKGREPELQQSVAPALGRSAHLQAPVVFRAGASTALSTPLSTYAGKGYDHTRNIAERNLKEMDTTQVVMH